jgi:hypothetical protein
MNTAGQTKVGESLLATRVLLAAFAQVGADMLKQSVRRRERIGRQPSGGLERLAQGFPAAR